MFSSLHCRVFFAVLLLCVLVGNRTVNAAQHKDRKTLVVEIQDFSEQKILPIFNDYLKNQDAVTIESYCPDQDLVIVSYDPSVFQEEVKVAAYLELSGVAVYLKQGLTIEVAKQQCILSFQKIIVRKSTD